MGSHNPDYELIGEFDNIAEVSHSEVDLRGLLLRSSPGGELPGAVLTDIILGN